jgi:hypothetical protein
MDNMKYTNLSKLDPMITGCGYIPRDGCLHEASQYLIDRYGDLVILVECDDNEVNYLKIPLTVLHEDIHIFVQMVKCDGGSLAIDSDNSWWCLESE